MNAIVNFNNPITMTSLEISELVQKRHDNVKRTIESLVNSDVISQPQIEDGIKSANGVIPQVYRFSGEQGKRNSIIVVAQLCPEFTARLVDRWMELENHTKSTAPQLPQSFSEALQLAADQARKIELDKPKVDYYEKIVVRDTLLNASQVAQKIKISAIKMNRYLDSLNVYHRGVKRARLFQQWFIDKGFGEIKQTELGFSQPMFTTLGEAWVIEKLVSEGVLEA